MVLALAGKLSRSLDTAFAAALAYLAFYATYRYGRPFCTNSPEVFWIFLPFFVLLYGRAAAFESRWAVPLLMGNAVGVALLYKSFALVLPVSATLVWWYLRYRGYQLGTFLRHDVRKVVVTAAVSLLLFGLWFLLDPDPHAVWTRFVLGENLGKIEPLGSSYLLALFWGSSSIWSLAAAFAANAGLLVFPVVALFVSAYRRRGQLRYGETLLWALIITWFLVFSIPSQRSGRYLLAVMPALAVLYALNCHRIGRAAFVASLAVAGLLLAVLADLALGLQRELARPLYPASFWLLLAGTGMLIVLALARPGLTRPIVAVAIILDLLCLAGALRPFDGPLGQYDAAVRQYALNRDIWVPCDARAKDEGYRFMLPGARIHGYDATQKPTIAELAARYPFFAVQVPRSEAAQTVGRVVGSRLVIRGHHGSAELEEMIRERKLLPQLLVEELLITTSHAPSGQKGR
jgi:4-amino-4-deoxy-L-arabinose transferase-like glycosyltransferase